jgi:hypothetical protein
MQNPIEQAKASILKYTTATRSGPEWNHAVKVRRKAGKRTLPFGRIEEELELLSPPHGEAVPARKKPRFEEPLPATSDQDTRETASPDLSVRLDPPTADNDDANADSVTDTQPNAGATQATRRWTLEEDAKLTSAVANTSKKKRGKEYKTNWLAVAALVPGRTRNQCCTRWLYTLDPSIGRASGRKGNWTAVEDEKLKHAVHTHCDRDWGAISALVPGRTKKQCASRWHSILDPSLVVAAGRTGKWVEDEDSKLKDAVQTHGEKDWAAIAALVPGRTKN